MRIAVDFGDKSPHTEGPALWVLLTPALSKIPQPKVVLHVLSGSGAKVASADIC